jgi:hypothetical protein
MKTTIIFSAIALALTLGACNNSSTTDSTNNAKTTESLDTTKLAKGTVFYQCPMHPEVTSDKAGSCSKCGMDLEKVEKK